MNKEILKKLQNTELSILNEIVRVCEKENITYFLIGGTLLGAIRHKGFIPWDDDIDIAMPRKDYEKFLKIWNNNNSSFVLDCHQYNKNNWLPFVKIRNINTIYIEKCAKENKGNNGIWVDIFPLDNAKRKTGFLLKQRFLLVTVLRFVIARKNNIDIKMSNKIKSIIINILGIIPVNILFKFQDSIMKKHSNKDTEYIVNLGSQYGYKKQTHLKEKYFPSIKVEFEGNLYNAPRDYNYVLSKIYGEDYMQLPPKEKRVTHNPLKIVFEDGQIVEFDKEN